MRWDADAEARLRAAEEELARAQKSWSERQEVWIEEVESLREMKKESEKFYRRREKLMKAEGVKFRKKVEKSKEVNSGSGRVSEDVAEWSGMEEEADEGMKSPSAKGLAVGGLLQRITSFPGSAVSTPNSSSQSSSRKSSFVGTLIRGGIFKRSNSV
jgi:hypothetical protein